MKHQYHTPKLSSNQCGSSLVQTIDAPLPLIWSVIRRFDNPQAYKQFVKSCKLSAGNGSIENIREVMVVSGLPAASSTERLDELDDECHVMMVSIIGGDHRLVRGDNEPDRLASYSGSARSKLDSSELDSGSGSARSKLDSTRRIPADCCFADMIIACNLRSLARVTEKMAML
ncbi:PYR1-like 11, regulatory components of ABA receptor 5 [Hibiscus trionum]|uniref:PYR1-like 11, regulatory components of ABA receptor 5 n=1 Tax=Hibiscus trionum TaxID=183268 RepID=A0A9W7HRT8_HIBTR|nr:PYR1-like 11, regulatory components of ABA receptor 5 [Hibiscus trionum]